MTSKRSKTPQIEKIDFYFSVYKCIKQGKIPSQICKELKVEKQKLTYYLNALKSLNLIRKVGYANWTACENVTKKKLEKMLLTKSSTRSKTQSSRGLKKISRPKTNLHAFNIKFPILSGTIDDAEWKVLHKMKNWIPKYTELDVLGGLQLKNNNNKSLTVYVKSRDFEDPSLDEIDNLAMKVKMYLHSYMKNKHGVELDILNCEVKNINLATEDKQSQSMIKKGEVFEVDLNKKSEKIFPNDKIDAKAWIDGSPFDFTAETNDKEWKREYLRMPFSIKSLLYSLPALQEYNENIKLHMKVQREQLKTQKEIQRVLHELETKI